MEKPLNENWKRSKLYLLQTTTINYFHFVSLKLNLTLLSFTALELKEVCQPSSFKGGQCPYLSLA